jgi:hypothetical protein
MASQKMEQTGYFLVKYDPEKLTVSPASKDISPIEDNGNYHRHQRL